MAIFVVGPGATGRVGEGFRGFAIESIVGVGGGVVLVVGARGDAGVVVVEGAGGDQSVGVVGVAGVDGIGAVGIDTEFADCCQVSTEAIGQLEDAVAVGVAGDREASAAALGGNAQFLTSPLRNRSTKLSNDSPSTWRA